MSRAPCEDFSLFLSFVRRSPNNRTSDKNVGANESPTRLWRPTLQLPAPLRRQLDVANRCTQMRRTGSAPMPLMVQLCRPDGRNATADRRLQRHLLAMDKP